MQFPPMKRKRRHVLAAFAIAATAALVGLRVLALLGRLDRTGPERVHGGGTRVVGVALVDALVGFDVTPDRLVVDRGTHLALARGRGPHLVSNVLGGRPAHERSARWDRKRTTVCDVLEGTNSAACASSTPPHVTYRET
jgi:hypothetical protein